MYVITGSQARENRERQGYGVRREREGRKEGTREKRIL